MSAIANLLRLPQYARNLGRLRQVTAVVIRHGFGHVLLRAGLDRYAGLINRGLVLTDADQELSELTWEHRVRLALESLGPTFIKLGQVAATRPDIIPMSLVFELRKLQDNVGGFGGQAARAMIESELGGSISTFFATFDDTPLAAASIAQVHRATLPTGEQVVIKVQRPQLDRIIANDLDLLHIMAAALEERVPEARQFRPLTLIEEFARNLKRETDFANERSNIERMRRHIAHMADVHVPVTYAALSTRRVLTMEFIAGCKVSEKQQMAAWNTNPQTIAELGTKLSMASIFEFGFFHADPHPGNFFILPNNRIALIDFGSMGAIDNDTIDELLTFLVSLLLNDPEMLVSQFIDLGLVDDTVNARAMQSEIGEIMARYNGATLGQLDIGQFIAEIFETVVRFQVQLPVELILIGKALSTMEGIARELVPNYNPLESLRPYLVQLYVRRVLDPKTYSKRVYRVLHDWWGLVRVAPADVRGLLRRAKLGQLQLQVRNPDAELLRSKNERTFNRALLALWSCLAWLMFTWILPQADRSPPWSLLWWYAILLGGQGLFAGSLAMVSWLRSREL
ncbi:MAG: 2-polyprenylphenol 6-hydroxylase [Myxococcales bacterium]|nr:2-polyprenylphenol 6-hydroxylase [Myxococcales bacterium]